ncbi:MAG: glutamine-hydrolyzing carbamoyl-phosphate synthase small subunit [Candidatus Hydrogenedens sp.]|nr:glutamine-hydrolyzing carbamoyl-phosphate synthase small subunit [Candidatus Hydrogenedens sp.]
MKLEKEAILALEDGSIFIGRSVGSEGETTGELVFNTSMTGYQEILTDPSYAGQIITMTYTHIGNYGCNPEDVESRTVFARGFVMRECCFNPSSWRATMSLPEFFRKYNVVAIDQVDTRKITRILRTKGNQKAIISTVDLNPDSLIQKAKNAPDMAGSDYVKEATITQPYEWEPPEHPKYRVVVMDFGVKYNILRLLRDHNCIVVVVPSTTPVEQILNYQPDGVVLSNGPGDPSALTYIYPIVQKLIEKNIPIMGICLGHQIIGHALGGKTFKLKFGHRGANQPVMNMENRRVEITSQNHGFAVDPDSLDLNKVVISHVHLNDMTCSGLSHKELPVFSVQYHPEASPGPHDSRYLFQTFTKLMDEYKEKRNYGKSSPPLETMSAS